MLQTVGRTLPQLLSSCAPEQLRPSRRDHQEAPTLHKSGKGDSNSGIAVSLLVCLLAVFSAAAQQPNQDDPQLVRSGQVTIQGHSAPYVIRRLPLNAFPDLPAKSVEQLSRRGCLIPQTYAAHHPENVVHASLETRGSSDWAVLCSAQGTVTLLVFFESAPGTAIPLASAAETRCLQLHDSTGVLGFNWAIDPASAETVHEAEHSMEPNPPPLDHDALADSVVDGRTIYRIYHQHAWTVMKPRD
jgi:hypothetical protein